MIIPAIDLQDGCVVRLVQGKLNKKIYSRDPVKTARHWVKQGAQLMHVVDLDGAFSGEPKNLGIVKEIAASVDAGIEFGGGVREIGTIKALIDSGIRRVVLGTRAAQDADFLKEAFKKFKKKIIVSIDARDTEVMVGGWSNPDKRLDLTTFACSLKKMGFQEIIYTDTLKDGTLSGPNIKGIKGLLKETGLRLIASGGIASLEDLIRLKKLEKEGLTGVIVGKALYEGKFTLSEALRLNK